MHVTECHHNPNYIITFDLNGCCHAYMVPNNEIVVSLYGNQLVIMVYEFGL